MPSYRLASAEGVFLTALLDDAGIDIDSIIGFNFISTDGFGSFMSKSELLDEERYYYPNIHGDNKEEDAVEVKPILATRSYVAAREEALSFRPDIIDKLNAIRLFVGQKILMMPTMVNLLNGFTNLRWKWRRTNRHPNTN